MIYHHRVRMSGVLLIQEALRMNGFTDELSAPTDATICAVCGIARSEHASSIPHDYISARFVVAHSDIDRIVMVRSIARYNALTNFQGYQYRVIIGSKIIREGINFRAVLHQFVLSLPTDIPTMLQMFGRVVRKDSHNDLPIDDRNVKISVFVSTRSDGRISPELQRYIDKGREYLVIQEVERAFHRYAIDGFANYDRIRMVLAPDGEMKSSIDALPYVPVVGPAQRPMKVSTYLAYGHGEREVATTAAICRVLFRIRPVWTYDDLWAAVRVGAVRGISFDPNLFDEGNFNLALESLRRPVGEPLVMVTRTGRFYVASKVQPDGVSMIDIESYLRNVPIPTNISINVSDYIRTERSTQNWEVRLREFEREFLQPDAKSIIEVSLIKFGANFHYTLIRKFIMTSEPITIDDERVRDMYRRFRIVVTVADATTPAASRIFRGTHLKNPNDVVGYVTTEAVNLYEGAYSRWYSASHTDFAIGRRHHENDIIIGFTSSGEETVTNVRFKIRPPIQTLRAETLAKQGDIRNLARGAVCETRSRKELEKQIQRLRSIIDQKKFLISSIDDAQYLSTTIDMCNIIKIYLLGLEENSRSAINGMTAGLRWLYLFNDKPPTVSALMGKTGDDK